MGILNPHTTSNSADGPLSIRRAASIAAGLFCGVTLTLHCVQANHGPVSVLAEATPSTTRAAAAKAKPTATPAKKVQDWHQIGLASWYGREFQGKETADGESFNMYDLTCAHRSLPLGTWVKVTNLHTRKWIVVRVNDRGPVPDTRIADLSSEAAYMLGMRARGVTRIRLDVIDPKAAIEIARLDRIRMAREAAEQSTIETGN
ncbi:MAG TPA: septal ring lytic transglycosylase RlpA family protein [Acidobacteriaceae bacterium]|nr:septal ring lytic transglycosylase RlpA family protein [Acidobacteriaceae bacterium]